MELNIPVKYRQDIENAVKLLKNEGCKAVFLFSSLVTGKIHDNSDIDSGIKGYPTGKFYRLYSMLFFDFDNKIDLVDFDKNEDLYLLLNEIGGSCPNCIKIEHEISRIEKKYQTQNCYWIYVKY